MEDYRLQKFLGQRKITDLTSDQAKEIFDVLDITEEDANESEIRILDEVSDDNLILVHYGYSTPATKHIRGLVIDIGTLGNYRIVCGGFPHTEEISATEIDRNTIIYPQSVITNAYEGTILRLFRGPVTNKWYLSTHRKIDGRKSRWSGPTFGQIFDEAWGDMGYECLEKFKYGWIFLVSHPENRLVCDIPSAHIRLVGIFSQDENKIIKDLSPIAELQSFNPRVEIQTLLEISNNDGLINFLENHIHWKECTGLLICTPQENNKMDCCKIMSPGYLLLRQVRDNEPNFRLRYLQLKLSMSELSIRELFPEKKLLFDQVEEEYNKLPEYLYHLYHHRYIRGNRTILPPQEHHILETVRRNYRPQLTLLENMQKIIRNQNVVTGHHLNAMIKHMKEKSLANKLGK